MRSLFGILTLFSVLLSAPAQGAITYEIFFRIPGEGDGFDSTIMVAPSQGFTGVQVMFRETVTGTDVSVLAADNMNAYSVDVGAMGSNGLFSNLTLDTTGGFGGGANDTDTLNYIALGAGFGTPGRVSTDIGGGQREAVLGTVDLTAPTIGQTTFTLADHNPGVDGDFTTFGTGAFGLESISAASGGGLFGRSVTLTAVPEPGSTLVVGGILACGLGRTIRRRRQSKRACPARDTIG